MTKKEKIACLEKAMTRSTRDDGTTFYHFTDEAPEELKDLYLEHYEVRDIDYETFNDACDIVSEVMESHPTEEEAESEIYERATDRASIMTWDRLQYLDNWNESEVSDIMREYGMHSIADAAAAWYDRQVEQQCMILLAWINA